jgi:hypothetical protein
MQTKTEPLAAQRRAPAAANEEFARAVADKAVRSRSSGWDPYEVWRTRVKPAQTLEGSVG